MSTEELREFKRLFGTTPNEQLAVLFNTSHSHVITLGKKYALGKDKKLFHGRPMPRWTKEEVDLLREIYPHTPNGEIAERMNRTMKSIVSKAHQLKIRKTADRLREMGLTNVKLRKDRSH